MNQLNPYLKRRRQHVCWQLTQHIKLRHNYWTSFHRSELSVFFQWPQMDVWDSWNHISTLLLDIYACILLLGLATQRRAMSRFDNKLSSPSFSTSRGLSAHLLSDVKWPHNARPEVFHWKCWTHDNSEVYSCATVRRENVITLKTWDRENGEKSVGYKCCVGRCFGSDVRSGLVLGVFTSNMQEIAWVHYKKCILFICFIWACKSKAIQSQQHQQRRSHDCI